MVFEVNISWLGHSCFRIEDCQGRVVVTDRFDETVGYEVPHIRADVGNVISCPPIRNGAHPTQKPLALLEQLLSVIGQRGDTILDPFMGSGTTAIAALKHGCDYLGIEINPEYVKVAEERIGKLQPTLFGEAV